MSKILIVIFVCSLLGIIVITYLGQSGKLLPNDDYVDTKYQNWGKNYSTVLANAKKSNKPIFILFTGSDWCTPCMLFYRDVFDKDDFKKFAKENLELLAIDFPKGYLLPIEQEKHNREMADKFKIDGFPTVVLLGNDEKEIARFGFEKKIGQEFNNYVTEKLKK